MPMPPTARAMTDDEKKAAFLNSQGIPQATAAPAHPPKPSADSTPTPKKKKKTKAKPKPARKKNARKASSEEKPPRKAPEPLPSPKPEEARKEPAQTSSPSASPSNPPSRISPSPSPFGALSGAAVVVQKSGAGEEEPLPTPEPEHHWSWWPFGGGPQYKYLTPAICAAIDKAPVARHRWRHIVVHNSGTRQGNAKAFDYYHRYVRKMPNGLAYHFVIGNGVSSANGGVEIGNRWTQQINGGHVHSDYLNNISLGICLVGDFNHDKPTPQQLEALEELTRYLRNRVGKTDHKPAEVIAHKDINPRPTDCPGTKFPYRWLYTRFD